MSSKKIIAYPSPFFLDKKYKGDQIITFSHSLRLIKGTIICFFIGKKSRSKEFLSKKYSIKAKPHFMSMIEIEKSTFNEVLNDLGPY